MKPLLEQDDLAAAIGIGGASLGAMVGAQVGHFVLDRAVESLAQHYQTAPETLTFVYERFGAALPYLDAALDACFYGGMGMLVASGLYLLTRAARSPSSKPLE